ncbi:MAG: hypothetical protein ACJ75Q_06110 [Gaiellaceae bacterium]
MTKGDLLVERGATRLQKLADRAAARGDGIGEWLSEELRNDAAFLRKLKPSLVRARAQGNAPTNQQPEAPPPPPAEPQPPAASAPKPKPKNKKKRSGGPPPVVIVGAALVAGIVLAKLVDWRGHAHPRD